MQQTKQQTSNSGLNAQQTGIEGAQGRTLVINGHAYEMPESKRRTLAIDEHVYEIAESKAAESGLTLLEMVECLLCKWIFNLLREAED